MSTVLISQTKALSDQNGSLLCHEPCAKQHYSLCSTESIDSQDLSFHLKFLYNWDVSLNICIKKLLEIYDLVGNYFPLYHTVGLFG